MHEVSFTGTFIKKGVSKFAHMCTLNVIVIINEQTDLFGNTQL